MRIFIFIIIGIFANTYILPVCANEADSLKNQIEEYTKKLQVLSQSKDTLNNQIKIINSQVELTLLKINQTQANIKILETDINQLTTQISQLDTELNFLTEAYIHEVNQNYRHQKRWLSISPSIFSNSFNDFLEQQKYIVTVQKNSQNTLIQLETSRVNYDHQKNQKELKQSELLALQKKLSEQQTNLVKQKKDKDNLLQITKNDETRYQKLKAAAQSELEALLTAIFDGTKEVKKGDPIGIMGNTGYSFGAHLHFGLYKLTKDQISSFDYLNDIDPAYYLDKYGWPMKNYRVSQARGHTPYSYLYSDRFHHGIDLYSDDPTIYAVNDGTAYFFKDKYPGKRTGSGNHVKLFHQDGHMTLYLHLEKFYR